MDWKNIVGSIAPGVATLLGGPLAGAGVKMLSEALLGKPDGTEEEVAQAVATMTPEQMVALRKIEADLKVQLGQQGIELAKIDADKDRAYLQDVADARHANSENVLVFWLGAAVLLAFLVVAAGSVYGAYLVLVGQYQVKDPGTLAAVFGLVGSIVGYFAAQSQTVVGFFYGSSRASQGKDAVLADSIRQITGKQ